jgi:hypothetical protein
MKTVGMVSTALFAVALAVVVAMVVSSLPELKRYLKMESM